DLVQTRILLESWAIARIDPKTASFVEMDEVLEQMEDFDLSIRDFLELLLTFHHQVMRCAGNELLVGLLASVRQPSFESMLSLVGRMPLWSSAVERLRAESRAIAEALKAGDAATARAMVIGQLRGMYSDAGIDLEQEATSANGLPGEPIASEFAPVDVDEFAADDFDDLMQDGPSFADAEALPAADAPVAAPASVEPAAEPVQASAPSSVVEYTVPEGDIVYIEETAAETPVERVDEPAEVLSSSNASGSDKVERSIPAVAQPAPAAPAQPTAHSVSADVPLSFGTPRRSTSVSQVTPAASAAPVASVAASSQTLASQPLSSQTLSSQTPSGQLPSVPAAYAQEEAEGPAKVLRASTAAPRRRSGQIISPVRATIIKPVDRSKVLTAPARTTRPAAVVTAAAPAESESAEKVLRAPARQEAPATEPAEPTRLEAAATIHDTYEKLPHDEPVQERGGIFSKMKRFFGVDVYEPEHDEAQESAEKDQAVKEQALKAETKSEPQHELQPEPQPVIDEEALARAEAERAERLKALHAAAEEEAAEESAAEEVSVEEPVEEPAEASEPAQESVEESAEVASEAEENTAEGTVASSGSVLSHGRGKGSKKSKKKRR
ncbi:MAG: FCD domain-containing protein, partial [Rothia mucilaginosa]|nr:FCD domain-containing protein [Rothia mucilaginosa]